MKEITNKVQVSGFNWELYDEQTSRPKKRLLFSPSRCRRTTSIISLTRKIHYHKPTWNKDASKHGEPVSPEEPTHPERLRLLLLLRCRHLIQTLSSSSLTFFPPCILNSERCRRFSSIFVAVSEWTLHTSASFPAVYLSRLFLLLLFLHHLHRLLPLFFLVLITSFLRFVSAPCWQDPVFLPFHPFVCASKGFKPLAGAPLWPPEPDRLTRGKCRCRQAPLVIPGDETTSLNTAECSGCSGNGLPRLIPPAPSLTTCPTWKAS